MKFTLSIEDKHGGIADEYSFDEGEFLIGRSHGADIILPSDNVSRRHARLYTIDGRCYIEDLGSANGVFVNGRRIHEVMAIEGSAQVRVGDYYLHVKSDKTEPAEDQVHCRLRGVNLGVADQVFPITRTVNLIGRGKDCTITIIDPSVSRIHAKLSAERSGALTLEDLKSSNGSFVNNERIEMATLSHRDKIRIGNIEMIVEFPDLTPSDGDGEIEAAGPTADDYGQGSAGRSGGRLKWVIIAVVATLVVVGGIVLLVVGGNGKNEPAEADIVAGTEAPTERAPLKTEAAVKAEEIAILVEEGTAQIKGRQWDRALTTWRKVLDRDPLHTDARKAINQVEIWQKHKAALDDARAAAKDKRYGEAARVLRGIDDMTSVYVTDAKDELERLMEMKPSLIMQADALVKSRDCKGALAIYAQAQELDPRDASLVQKIKAVQKKAKKKCR